MIIEIWSTLQSHNNDCMEFMAKGLYIICLRLYDGVVNIRYYQINFKEISIRKDLVLRFQPSRCPSTGKILQKKSQRLVRRWKKRGARPNFIYLKAELN